MIAQPYFDLVKQETYTQSTLEYVSNGGIADVVRPRIVDLVRTCTVRPILIVDDTIQCTKGQLTHKLACNFRSSCFSREGIVEVHVECSQVVGCNAVVTEGSRAEA